MLELAADSSKSRFKHLSGYGKFQSTTISTLLHGNHNPHVLESKKLANFFSKECHLWKIQKTTPSQNLRCSYFTEREDIFL
jgi:hypothetical protein